jgi:hypothetical protein
MFHINGKHKETYFYKLAHTFAQLSHCTSLAPFILSHQPYLHCNILNTNIITIFPISSNKPVKKNHKCPNNVVKNTSHDIRTHHQNPFWVQDKNSKVTITNKIHQKPKTQNP